MFTEASKQVSERRVLPEQNKSKVLGAGAPLSCPHAWPRWFLGKSRLLAEKNHEGVMHQATLEAPGVMLVKKAHKTALPQAWFQYGFQDRNHRSLFMAEGQHRKPSTWICFLCDPFG